MLSKFYQKLMYWASHKNSNIFLLIYSFFEAIILPLPIDILLGPIAMQKPNQWFRLATYAAVASTFGGLFGYLFGFYLQDTARVIINYITNNPTVFDDFNKLFVTYGALFIVIVGFTPIPFKVFSILFGIFQLNLLEFLSLSLISRQVRFMIVSYLFAVFGDKYRTEIERIVSNAGWYILTFAVLGFLLYKAY